MAKRSKKLIGYLILASLPVCGIVKLAESIEWGLLATIYAFSFIFVYGLANESNRKNEKIINYDQRKANLPPTRNNAKSDIDKFFNEKGKTKIIVFDVETNGLDIMFE